MKNTTQCSGFRQTLIALAAVAACASVYAQDSEIKQLTSPESSITLGGGAVTGLRRDRALMGQYNGLRDYNGYFQLDVDINKRDDATGTSMTVKGRNLGLDSRDLSFTHEKQGDWKYGLDYSELVRHDPRTVNTGMTGAGTTTPNVVRLATPGSGADLDFKMKRVGLGLMGEKWITNNLQLEVNFKAEDKSGERRFGRGYACAAYVCTNTGQSATTQTWALLMMAEPIQSTTKQIDAKLNFSADKLNLSVGYYGSFYTNANGNLTATVPNQLNNPTGGLATLSPAVAGGTSLQNVMQMPTALAPDNQAHQFYVAGNYAFTPTTRATFKYAFTHATQDEDFASMGLVTPVSGNPPAGVSSLGGVVDTTLMQLGLTARPLPKLSVVANLRYEDKDDKTPRALYNVQNTAVWYNSLVNSTKLVGKLDGTYRLANDLRATLGLDYSDQDRPVPVSITEEKLAGLGAVRAKNREAGYRLELRRSMSETLTGAVGYSRSNRTGSDWTSLNTGALFQQWGLGYGQTGTASLFIGLNPTNAFPMNMADVRREKVKLSASWTPSEQVEVQFYVENGEETNTTSYSEIAGGRGWRSNGSTIYSVDASYAMSDTWKLNGYISQGDQKRKVTHSVYTADLSTRSDAIGLGVIGQPTGRLELGANLMYLNDDSRYGLAAMPTATGGAPTAANVTQAAIGLPNVKYEITSLNLFAKYALDKNSAIRVNLLHQSIKLDEWSYGYNGVPFVYSDNTTVNMSQVQAVTAIGVAYILKF